jgi:ferrochelatase
MGGYARDLEAARAGMGPGAPAIRIAGAWHLEPGFVEALAGRIREGLAAFPAGERDRVPLLLTAHSLPRRVAESEPDYLEQLRATAESVARDAGIAPDRWTFCWQSAGHEPGEWMKPDFADLMPELAARGHRSVLVAPIQFLADHLEILYDVEIGAREQAEEHGLAFNRIRSLNTDPVFIDALASVARTALAASDPAFERASVPRS